MLTASHSCAHTRDRTHVAPAGKTKRQEPPLPLLLVFVPKAQTLTPEVKQWKLLKFSSIEVADMATILSVRTGADIQLALPLSDTPPFATFLLATTIVVIAGGGDEQSHRVFLPGGEGGGHALFCGCPAPPGNATARVRGRLEL